MKEGLTEYLGMRNQLVCGVRSSGRASIVSAIGATAMVMIFVSCDQVSMHKDLLMPTRVAGGTILWLYAGDSYFADLTLEI